MLLTNKTLYFFLFFFTANFLFSQNNWLVKNPNGFDFYITTKVEKNTLVGYSRPKALKEIIGGLNFSLIKSTTSIKHPEIIHFKGLLNNSYYEGEFQNLFDQSNFKAKITKDSLIIHIQNKNGAKSFIKAKKVEKIKPLRNYKETFKSIFKLTEDNIYNPLFIESKDWKKFKKQMNKLSKSINDDYELQIAFYAFARKFPFSHYYLGKHKETTNNANGFSGFANLKHVNTKTCILKIDGFYGSKKEMDSLIKIINNKNYKNLIIDLRDNQGGDLEAAFPLAEFIIDHPIIAGVFPNKNWYEDFKKLPTKDDYSKFTEFTGGTLDQWYKKASENYGAYYKVNPSKIHFNGQVYILTNTNTASTCEPLVFGLKHHKFATVIGENTAGAMLYAKQFVIENIFELTIPLNDYITYSGERIDNKGVKPNIEVKSTEALKYVLDLIE